MTLITPDPGLRELYTVAQVRDIEAVAKDLDGIPGIALMQRAGEVCWTLIQQRYPTASRITVLCGKGNNAGDGFVIARLAHQAGKQVCVVLCADTSALRDEAAQAFRDLLHAGVHPVAWATFSGHPVEADVCVDALLGIGIQGAPRDSIAEAIAWLNVTAKPTLAVDIPSGLNADTGAIEGACVHATITVSFIGLKRGLVTGKARNVCGDLIVDRLGIPASTFKAESHRGRAVLWHDVTALLPHPKPASYKHQRGHCLIIGGAAGMGGAVCLAAESSLRAGAGLVTAFLHAQHLAALNTRCPEVMALPLDATALLPSALTRANAIVIGPGLSQAEWALTLLKAVLDSKKPLVLDADALRLAAHHHLPIEGAVITPHPGEAAALLNASVAEVENDRFGAAFELVNRFHVTVLLKGAGSVVADQKRLAVLAGGNAGMATAGAGDVLSGIVGALLAQGLRGFDAALLAGAWHAEAGDRAAQQGQLGMIASDLILQLRAVANSR